MKIRFYKKDVLPKLKYAASLSQNKGILQHVKITASKMTGIDIQATDGDVAIRFGVGCDVFTEGMVLVPAKKMVKILESSKADWWTLERVGDDVVLNTEDEEECFTVSESPDDFPDVEVIRGFKVPHHNVKTKWLRTMIKRTVFAIDKKHPQYAGVCLETNGNQVHAVPTDVKRIAWQEGLGTSTFGHEFERVIVPVSALKLWDRVINDMSSSEKLRYSYAQMIVTEETIQFPMEGITLVARLIEGGFPKWRNVIPKTDGNEPAIVKCEKLQTEFERAANVTVPHDYDKNVCKGIRFFIEPGKLILRVGKGDDVRLDTSIPVTYNGVGARFMIDPTLLTGFLKALDKDVKVSIYPGINSDEPVSLTVDDGYRYVVMPMLWDERTPEEQAEYEAENKRKADDGKPVTVLRENGARANGTIVPDAKIKRNMVAFADSQSGKMYNIPVRCCTRTKAGSIAYIILTDDDLRLDNSLLGIFTSSFMI
jgi:DNA polymerase-3 subunit beta